MRILQVSDTLDAGGSERVAIDLANWLRHENHEVFYCATRADGILRSELDKRIQFVSLRRKYIFSGLLRFRNFVKTNRISIVHAHGNSSAKFCVAALIGLPGVAIVHHDHNPVLAKRKAWQERLLLARCAAWIAVSKPILEWALDKVKFKGAVMIQNPVTLSRFQKPEGGIHSPARFVSMTNYRIEKNYMNLLKAALKLYKENIQISINCYGGHDTSELYKEIVEARNQMGLDKMVGLNPRTNDVAAILERSDAGIVFSDYEGLPVSLLEYMASYLPVVVTDVGECGDLVRKSGGGFVVPPGDPEALANAIVQLLTSPEAKVMGEKNRKYVEDTHSVQSTGNKIVHEVYSRI